MGKYDAPLGEKSINRNRPEITILADKDVKMLLKICPTFSKVEKTE